jgi:hypothetical protein
LRFDELALRVTAEPPWLLEALGPWLSRFELAAAGSGADMAISLRAVESVTARSPDLTYCFDHFSTSCYSGRAALHLFDQGSYWTIPDDQATCEAWVEEGVQAEPWVLEGALIVALIELLRRRSLYQLHAGCVVPDGATGVLISGNSGSGKSTAVTALLSAGWRYIGDDLLFVKPRWGVISMVGWREMANLSRKCADAFGLPMLPERARPDGRYVVDLDERFPGARIPSARPKVLLVCEVAQPTRSEVTPLKRAHALAVVVRQSPLVLVTGRLAEEHMCVLHGLVEQCDCYTLRAGEDVFDGALPDLIAPLVS